MPTIGHPQPARGGHHHTHSSRRRSRGLHPGLCLRHSPQPTGRAARHRDRLSAHARPAGRHVSADPRRHRAADRFHRQGGRHHPRPRRPHGDVWHRRRRPIQRRLRPTRRRRGLLPPPSPPAIPSLTATPRLSPSSITVRCRLHPVYPVHPVLHSFDGCPVRRPQWTSPRHPPSPASCRMTGIFGVVIMARCAPLGNHGDSCSGAGAAGLGG